MERTRRSGAGKKARQTQAAEQSEKTLIFLHIPKTAGTAFNHVLRDVYGARFYRVKPGGKWRKTKRLPGGMACVTGHMPWGVHDKWLLDYYRYITILRHPVDRIISLWWFVRQSIKHPHPFFIQARQMNIAQFATSELFSDLDNGMVRWLAGMSRCGILSLGRKVEREDLDKAKEHLDDMLFGFIDTLKYDVKRFGMILGWPEVNSPKIYMASKGKPTAGQIPAQQLDRVMCANLCDLELYNWALNKRGID